MSGMVSLEQIGIFIVVAIVLIAISWIGIYVMLLRNKNHDLGHQLAEKNEDIRELKDEIKTLKILKRAK